MADPSNLPPLPKNHLDHPEQWTTGDDPATEKQKGFIKVLEGQHKDLLPEHGLDTENMGKSEASEVIDKLKNGKPIVSESAAEKARGQAPEDAGTGMEGIEAAEKLKETRQQEEELVEAAEEAEGNDKEQSNSSSKKRRAKTDDAAEDSESSPSAKKDAKSADTSGDADDKMSERKAENGDQHEGGSKLKQTSLTESITKGSKDDDEKDDSASKEDDKDEHKAKKAKMDEDKQEKTKSPAKSNGTSNGSMKTKGDGEQSAASANGHGAKENHSTEADDTIPGDGEHLDHPENWATGDEPATEKQKGYVAVLEKQKGVQVSSKEGLGKSEASEKIDELQKV